MKTTSLELSKQLKESGAKQESEQFWIKRTLVSKPSMMSKDGEDYSYEILIAASFDCHELLERLPKTIDKEVGFAPHIECWTYELTITFEERELVAEYVYRDYSDLYQLELAGVDDIPAEALGKLYLWCLQNGYCEKGG